VNGILQSEIAVGYDWIWDKPLYVTYNGGCCDSKRRIDLWTIIGNVIVAIEIDENQHKYYKPDHEQNRYNDLVMDFTGRFVFLRINPDPFWGPNHTKLDPPFQERLTSVQSKLTDIFQYLQESAAEAHKTDDLVTVHHMFYDAVE